MGQILRTIVVDMDLPRLRSININMFNFREFTINSGNMCAKFQKIRMKIEGGDRF